MSGGASAVRSAAPLRLQLPLRAGARRRLCACRRSMRRRRSRRIRRRSRSRFRRSKPAGAGLGISPLLLALAAIARGVGLYLVLHHKSTRTARAKEYFGGLALIRKGTGNMKSRFLVRAAIGLASLAMLPGSSLGAGRWTRGGHRPADPGDDQWGYQHCLSGCRRTAAGHHARAAKPFRGAGPRPMGSCASRSAARRNACPTPVRSRPALQYTDQLVRRERNLAGAVRPTRRRRRQRAKG